MHSNARVLHARVCALLLFSILAANLLAAPLPVARAAATWYVAPASFGNDANDCLTPSTPCATIAGALGKAAADDTINVQPGIYLENLTINKNIALIGAGAGATIVDGGGGGTVITISISSTVSISGLAIQNGNAAGGGGGISNQGNLTLSNAILRNNRANVGSAIATSGSLAIADSVISNNGPATGTVYGTGTITIDRSTFTNNVADNGGALYLGGLVTIRASTFTGNRAASNDGGAIFANGGTMTIENSTISGNSASQTGGGLVTSSAIAPTVLINNSTFANNGAGVFGGNIAIFQGSVTARNTIVANPVASGNCAGALINGGNNLQFGDASCGSSIPLADPRLGPLQNNGGPTATHALLAGSPALDAGSSCTLVDQRGVPRPQGVACDIGAYERGATTLHVAPAGDDARDCLSAANACRTIGAAVFKAGGGDTISIASGNYRENILLGKTLTLQGQGEDTTIIDGRANGRTIEISSTATVTITGVTITNGAADLGAGISNTGILRLFNSTVSNNSAPVNGGGVYNEASGNALIVDSTISGNSAQYGAGIYNFGQLLVVRSTISGNNASVFGSGLQNWGSANIRNSTFADNRAAVTGGALHISGGTVELLNSTIAANSAQSYGGGLSYSGGNLTLANTIVANNSAPSNSDISGPVISQGYNLVRNPAGASGLGANDLLTLDPQLGELRDNGGATPTYAPNPASPTIDAVKLGTCPALDQRGIPRPQGDFCDIGAFETAKTTEQVMGEDEPNNFVEQANLLVFGRGGHTARSGTISATTDLDIYTFSAQPGATVAISLTNLPADYDIALLSDPRVTIPVSDSVD
ncbi:MAG TPA: choice-of-anchor Q domain-containing protein, partial [Roseiflexaceae bacterium]|nr:choice-of-anchor Q domain-containing protein [Roseiflexaceae bacterium]